MSDSVDSVFQSRWDLPDDKLEAQAKRLVGFGERFDRLSAQLRLITDMEGVREWADRHHNGGANLVATLSDRYPLVVFHGDVGTGKTSTAEASADGLARILNTQGFLL